MLALPKTQEKLSVINLIDPVQQPTSEIQDNSIGEMMLLGKKSSPLCVQIEGYGKSMFYFISDFFETLCTPAKYMFMHI